MPALQTPHIVNITAKFLKLLIILNLLCVPLFCGMLGYSIFGQEHLIAALAEDYGTDTAQQILPALRWTMVIGLAMIPFAHIILTYLRNMALTIPSKHVFSKDNVLRLRKMAWALLCIQILDLFLGTVAWNLNDMTAQIFGWGPSFASWLCVLLLFVLSHIFQQGVEMRDDLEGVV